jgi:hypothetical protein
MPDSFSGDTQGRRIGRYTRTIRTMIDYECPSCGSRGQVADVEQLSQLCSVCKATAIWEALPAETWRIVGEELIHGRTVHAIKALRDAHPSIGLAEAIGLVTHKGVSQLDGWWSAA